MPVTRLNFATFPGFEQRVASVAPASTTPNCTETVQENLAEQVSDVWEGLPVRF